MLDALDVEPVEDSGQRKDAAEQHEAPEPGYRPPQRPAQPSRRLLWLGRVYTAAPWHFLNLRPLPHGQGSFRPGVLPTGITRPFPTAIGRSPAFATGASRFSRSLSGLPAAAPASASSRCRAAAP